MNFLRYATRHPGSLIASLITGLIAGVAYRSFVDAPDTRDLANHLRSGLHGIGIALAGWSVQAWFASGVRSRLGLALRRLPLLGEVLMRSLVMTAAFVIVGVFLQFVIYAAPEGQHWLTGQWIATTLPWIVAMGFGMSLLIGMIAETANLIGRPLLVSVALGTYHRPAREPMIVMFLDLVSSTRLAEEMGELRVHDLITRFFFDIDDAIGRHGGAVHAYVGDAVIVTWPLTDDAARNARCLTCFFTIERTMDRPTDEYCREFSVAPRFRAGMHAGPVIVSECGGAKRQLAYFGDTMNVAARLCEYCKVAGQRLVVSSDLLRQVTIPPDLQVDDGESVDLRGRQEPVETHAIRSIGGCCQTQP
jgi:class 3 adenylate cyclase